MSANVRLVRVRPPCPQCGGLLYRSIIGVAAGDAENPDTFRRGPVRCSQGCKLADGEVEDDPQDKPAA